MNCTTQTDDASAEREQGGVQILSEMVADVARKLGIHVLMMAVVRTEDKLSEVLG